jgi:hypothetical protein
MKKSGTLITSALLTIGIAAGAMAADTPATPAAPAAAAAATAGAAKTTKTAAKTNSTKKSSTARRRAAPRAPPAPPALRAADPRAAPLHHAGRTGRSRYASEVILLVNAPAASRWPGRFDSALNEGHMQSNRSISRI